MGFRSSIRKGGGFLNGVTGKIVKTAVESFDSKKGDEMLSIRLYIQQDGADEPVDTSLFYGAAEGMVVSDDKLSISREDGEPVRIGADTGLGIFMASLLDIAPELEARLPDLEAGEALSLVGIHGLRVEFRQRVNEEATKQRGKRKAKNGREYSLSDLVVERVLELPTGKGGAKSANGSSAKAGAKTAKSGGDLAQETVVSVLKDFNGVIERKKLKMQVFKKFDAKHPQKGQRDAIVAQVTTDDYINGLVAGGVIEYDADSDAISLVS